MNAAICPAILDMHPTGTLSVGLDGRIVYANRQAKVLLDPTNAGVDGVNFFELWTMSADQVRDMIGRGAGSSAWQPLTLVLKDGAHAGIRLPLKIRGIMQAEGPQAIIVSDEARNVAFDEHRALVRALNTELAKHRKLEVSLNRALANETRLHRELIHRVKNNLSVLAALVRFRASASDNQAVKAALQEVEQRTVAIALVHDVLDRKKEIDVVDADQLIDQLCRLLETSICPPGITIHRELTPYKLYVEDATPLCLLVNELVTNSLKHAFPSRKRGKVEVKLKRNGVDKLEVNVADDGVGHKVAEAGAHNGKSIVEALARQLRGDLTVHSEGGTSWQLIFPPVDVNTPAH